MIEIVTGLPGAGKTLITLVRLKALAEKEGRPVYYSGIDDLKLPWVELEKAEDWASVPPKSIVVIDEAQRVFRVRAPGSVVPKHVEALETHRHAGIDLVLITQHPMLLDTNVRRLAGRHIHTVRAFGAKFATLHEWGGVKEQCDKSRADSIESKWFYPAKAYDWYKSAEAHTHKMRFPWRVLWLFVVPVVLIGAAWTMYRWQSSATERTNAAIGVSAAPARGGAAAVAGPAGGGKGQTAQEYFESYRPRVPGLVHTAAVYDEITKPQRAPVPAACVIWQGKGCRCYTQQATQLGVPDQLCKQIALGGYFIAFDPEGKVERGADRRGSASTQVAAAPASVGPFNHEIPLPESGAVAAPAKTVPKIYEPGTASDPHRGR